MSTDHEALVELLQEIHHSLGEHAKKVFAEYGFSFTSLMIVKKINHEPGITVSELARQTGVAKSHISTMVNRLHQQGWVKKEPDLFDQRLIRLYLTSISVEELLKARSEIRKRLATLISPLSIPDAKELIVHLESLQDILEHAKKKEKKDEHHSDK